MEYLSSALIGYLFGSFPTGYLVGRLWNVDVRKLGSGRTGGTNLLRTLGWKAFTLTVAGDILKGITAVLLIKFLFPFQDLAHVLALLGVLIGNNWSIWIAIIAESDSQAVVDDSLCGWIRQAYQRGRGGAGVAATAGAGLALYPPCGLIMIPVTVLVIIVVRYASVASLTAATLYPIVMLFFAINGNTPWSYFIFAFCAGIIVYIVHIPNIQRLRAGTERRFGQRLEQNPPAS